MITANDIRVGDIILFSEKLYRVTKTSHTQPGKGGAYIQCTLQAVQGTQKRDERFRSSEKVAKVDIQTKEAQYLYKDIKTQEYTFMFDTAELITINENLIEDIDLISEDMNVKINYFDDQIISVRLPDTFNYQVISTPPYIKGQSESSQLKSAVIQNNVIIKVPQYVTSEDIITIKVQSREFVSRVL